MTATRGGPAHPVPTTDDALPAPGGTAGPAVDAGRAAVLGGLSAARRWMQEHPRLVDGALALALVLMTLPGFDLDGGHEHGGVPDAGTTVLLTLAAAAIVARRSHPLPVWAATSVLGVLAVLSSHGHPPLPLPTFVALYTVGRFAAVRSTVLATAATGVAFAVALTVAEGSVVDERGDFPALATLALSGAAAAVGVAVRSQRAALEAAEARAQQAERTRDEEARRQVTDERVRIARELHDVVAHHISVINVQAGVARHLMDSNPDQARTALGLVRDASKTVLTEMSSVVGLLRTREEDAPREPTPGLAALPSLVDSVRRAGLDVRWEVTGTLADLTPICDLTAYRVVQESLTNALKHGRGTADLLVDSQPDRVVMTVRNPVAEPGRPAGGGHGLVGMRERVEAVHGVLVTGPGADGSFTVRAEIPLGVAGRGPA